MPIQPGDPLLKVTLNLYTEDVRQLKFRYGFGWSAHARDAIHEYLHKMKTIEDLVRQHGESSD